MPQSCTRYFIAGAVLVLAIAEVPLHEHDLLHDVEHAVGGRVAQRVGQAGERLLFLVCQAHAASHIDVEAVHVLPALAQESDQTDIVGEDVRAVVTREGDGSLELAREVGFTVDRLFLAGERLWLVELLPDLAAILAAQPDLVVSWRARAEMLGDLAAYAWICSRTGSPKGAGQHITLRSTSPQAANVLTSAWFRARIVSVRSPLITPCNWIPWRVVRRKSPCPKSSASRSWTRYCWAVSLPPGNLLRTMKEYCLLWRPRISRSCCW